LIRKTLRDLKSRILPRDDKKTPSDQEDTIAKRDKSGDRVGERHRSQEPRFNKKLEREAFDARSGNGYNLFEQYPPAHPRRGERESRRRDREEGDHGRGDPRERLKRPRDD